MLSYIEFHGLCELAFWARVETHGYVRASEFGASSEAEHVLSLLLSRGLVERATAEELQPHVAEHLEMGETYHRLLPPGLKEVRERAIPGLDFSAVAEMIANAERAKI